MSTTMLHQPGVSPARFALTPSAPSPNDRPGRGPAFAYTVRPGNTLMAIARASGVPIAELMRRNPAINGNMLRPGDRIWVPDLLPSSAGEPAVGLAARTANGGEVRMSADRRFVAVLDSSVMGSPNSLTLFDRKTGKHLIVPNTDATHVWKRIGWSPNGPLLAIEGLRTDRTEGGTFVSFDPFTGIKSTLLSPKMALEDLREEGHCPEMVEVVSFRPIKDKLTYRLALRDSLDDEPLFSDWVMNSKGQNRQRA